MSQITYQQLAPEAVSKLGAFTKYLESTSLDPLLPALVEIMAASMALTYMPNRRGGWRDAATTRYAAGVARGTLFR